MWSLWQQIYKQNASIWKFQCNICNITFQKKIIFLKNFKELPMKQHSHVTFVDLNFNQKILQHSNKLVNPLWFFIIIVLLILLLLFVYYFWPSTYPFSYLLYTLIFHYSRSKLYVKTKRHYLLSFTNSLSMCDHDSQQTVEIYYWKRNYVSIRSRIILVGPSPWSSSSDTIVN